VSEVISERERRVREQNEQLRHQLSMQYSESMRDREKENEGMRINFVCEGDTSTVSDYRPSEAILMHPSGSKATAKIREYSSPSSTTESHFTSESSDVESYHQPKIKQHNTHMMTQLSLGMADRHPSSYSSSALTFPSQIANPVHMQTHLMPLNHHQLANIPNSKSSVGDDISSSFVSSATETESEAPDTNRPLTYAEVSDSSLLTSQDSSNLPIQQRQLTSLTPHIQPPQTRH